MATKTRKNSKAESKSSRYSGLRKMLIARQGELAGQLHGKMRDVRAEGRLERDVLDPGESSDSDIQEDIELALIQMKSETLNKINEALGRLEQRSYGNCFECEDEISEARLRALPFAARCKECEETRENAEHLERVVAQKRSPSLFYDMSH